jgi:hypothetical protein
MAEHHLLLPQLPLLQWKPHQNLPPLQNQKLLLKLQKKRPLKKLNDLSII